LIASLAPTSKSDGVAGNTVGTVTTGGLNPAVPSCCALDPDEVIAKFGADALRFYCFREVSFGQDGQISPAGFESRYETELADQYGNLANRTLAMTERYRDGEVPEAEVDGAIAADFEGAPDRVRELLDRAELTQALEVIWKLVRRLNQYVEEARPWDLAKDDGVMRAAPAGEAEEAAINPRLDQVLYTLAEGLRVTTLLLHPYIPEAAGRLLDALGEPSRELAELGSREGGRQIERIPPLFPKLEAEPAA
jgi:methionyl-tRNA synthetase